MSFFCAGSNSQSVKKKMAKGGGSKSAPQPVSKSSSNGRASNPFQDNKEKSLPTIPFSDQPNTRRMIVLQEFVATDDQGLSVHKGEMVQVLNEDGNWCFARNENKKEGFVPRSHLVAPYSSTRTGRKSQTSNPIRPVASGGTVLDQDSNWGVSMYPCHSAGVPRGQDDHLMNRANSYGNRGSSPQICVNDTCNNNNFHGVGTNGMTVSMYDQKHSPSSSSGVASMNGPSSPSFQSFPENYSQENMGRQSSGSSLTQERNSLSSIEENGMEVHHSGFYPPNDGRYRDEDPGMYSHRTNSESNLMHMQARPLPHPPSQPDQEGVYLDKRMNHIYSTITNGESPPPIPPRDRPPPLQMSSASQPYPESEMYTSPADAIVEQQGPHLDRPRVQSLSDVRTRKVHAVKPTMDYSEVYQGRIRTHRQNGHHHGNDSASEHSEGGSSSNRSSQKGSTSRRQPLENISGLREFAPQEPRHLSMAHVPKQSSSTRISKFRRCLWGVYVVTKTFSPEDENELSVIEGEHVSVWNQDDQDWFWIVKHSTSEEGFVPSCFLKEVVSSEAQPSTGPRQSQTLPPIPPKQRASHTHQQESQFRQRSQSQDSRSTHQIGRSRGRRNSDSSSKSHSSIRANHSRTSIEKMEIPKSPSNSPPPPYSEFDHHHQPHTSHHTQSHASHHPQQAQHSYRPTRHHSLSQQHEHSVQTSQMHRTRSQGHVTRHRYVDQAPPPMQRYLSPPDTYNLHSPTNVDGGTLV